MSLRETFRPRNKAELRTQFNLPAERKILLYVGRLSCYDKSDLLPLLFGFKRFLRESTQSPLFLIVGGVRDGVGYSDVLRKYVRAMHLENSVW